MGLISVAEIQVETAQDVTDVLPLHLTEGFRVYDLMIRQTVIRGDGHNLKTFDHKAAKLASATPLGTSQRFSIPLTLNVDFSLGDIYFEIPIIVDGRNVCDPAEFWEAGLVCVGFGRSQSWRRECKIS